MTLEKRIGILLIAGVAGVCIPYLILSVIFDYPAILRQDAGIILAKFYEGGNRLILTWWAFALLGLPLLNAYVLIGQKIESKFYFVRWATLLGVVGLLMQIIGLLRWTFVVPVLANHFVSGNETAKEISKLVFQVVHQYGGVILGEHLGQLFTIAWTVMTTRAFSKLTIFPKWIIGLGYVSSFIYLFAQAELFATVIPDFPVWRLAGFLGSTLWLTWLLAIGIQLLKKEIR